jgi:uridine kinase
VLERRNVVLRRDLVEQLARLIADLKVPRPARVAIDGPDAAGKTTLADELGAALTSRGRDVIRASIDGFHRPRAERHRRGSLSPDGYYDDSFDYDALHQMLLGPLSPGGERRYRHRVFEHGDDARCEAPWASAAADAVLLLDGVFLLRPGLAHVWDLAILVSVNFEEVLRRALVRDVPLLGSREEVEQRYRERYIPGQQLYFAAAQPERAADVIVYNDDPKQPALALRSASHQPPSG